MQVASNNTPPPFPHPLIVWGARSLNLDFSWLTVYIPKTVVNKAHLQLPLNRFVSGVDDPKNVYMSVYRKCSFVYGDLK